MFKTLFLFLLAIVFVYANLQNEGLKPGKKMTKCMRCCFHERMAFSMYCESTSCKCCPKKKQGKGSCPKKSGKECRVINCNGVMKKVVAPKQVFFTPDWSQYKLLQENEHPVLKLILDMVRDLIIEQELDPFPLPDDGVSFSKKIAYITFHGSAKIYNGFLSGISKIKQTGPFKMESEFNKLIFDAIVGVDTGLKVDYSASANFMALSVSASASGYVQTLSVNLGAEFCPTTSCKHKLTKFKINEIGRIDIDVHGLGPLNFILESLGNLIINIVKKNLVDLVENKIKKLIQDAMDKAPKLPFP